MKNKKYLKILFIIAVFVLISLVAIFLRKNEKNIANEEIGDTINIGVVTNLGTNFKYAPIAGSGAYAGAMAYLKKINASGGIYNRKINFITRDVSNNNPTETAIEAKKLIQGHNIFAFMWPLCTLQTKTIQDFLKGTDIPLLFPLSSNISSNTKGIYYIRPGYEDEIKHEIRRFIQGINDTENASVATEREEVCYINKTLFLKLAGKLKKKINPGFYYNPLHKFPLGNPNDFKYNELRDNIISFKKNNVKTVVLFSTVTGAYFLRMAESLNYHPNYLSPSILNADFILTHFFPMMNNFYTTTPFPIPAVSSNFKVVNEFKQDMKDNGYSGYLSTVMLEGYLGAKILVDTLKKAGPNLTRKRFIDALEGTKNLDYGGISFSFSPNENMGNHKVYFYKYVNGKPELVKY